MRVDADVFKREVALNFATASKRFVTTVLRLDHNHTTYWSVVRCLASYTVFDRAQDQLLIRGRSS